MTVRRHELTDAEWERLAPLLPPEKPPTGKANKPHRPIINGILWKLRTGAPWRDLPERYGPWQTVVTRFRRWRLAGVWDRVLAAVRADDGPPPEEAWAIVTLDGTVLFNGRPLTPDEFATEVKNPKWAGSMLHCHQRDPKTRDERQQQKASRFAEIGSFARFLYAAAAGTRWAGFSWQNDEGDAGDGELSLEQAVARSAGAIDAFYAIKAKEFETVLAESPGGAKALAFGWEPAVGQTAINRAQ